MSNKIHTVLIALLIMIAFSSLMVTPVAADDHSNIICETNGDDYEPSSLGDLVSTVTTLIVTIAAIVAVVGGAGYTLASAANPTEEKYIENRNDAIKYGAGALLVLYGANAITSELDEELDFSCVLPFS